MSSISSDMIRGHIEAIILKILAGEDNYGYNIYKKIMDQTQNQYELKEASLYSALRRLEAEEAILSYWGDETQGGRRKYYTTTKIGLKKLENLLKEWQQTKAILECLLERKNIWQKRSLNEPMDKQNSSD